MTKLKSAAKKILPAIVIFAIRQIRKGFQLNNFIPIKGTYYPIAKGRVFIIQARQHLVQAKSVPDRHEITPSRRWSVYLEKMHSDINKLETTRDIIYYSQGRIGFDHRGLSTDELPYLKALRRNTQE